jgi:hypothetical protein
MQVQSARTSRPRYSPKEAVPYTLAAIGQDLERVRTAWDDCQATRDRDAIYAYLNAVYALVAWWTAEGREIDRARRALRLCRLDVSEREDAFTAVIRCTADPAKADKRTRSKWSRVIATQWPTSLFASHWSSSSNGRVGSARAPLGSPGAWGSAPGNGARGGWRKGEN